MKDTVLPNGLKIFHLNSNETSFLYQEIFQDAFYLKHGVAVTPRDIVFDVGANIGLFSIWLHQQFPGVRIYAFEPIPDVYRVLASNFASLGIAGKAIDCALADKVTTAQFTYYPNNSVMSGRYAQASEDIQVTSAFMNNKNPAFAEAVKKDPKWARHREMLLENLFQEKTALCTVKTVSEIMRDEKLDRIDLLKVDVEKSEHEVLAGVADSDWPKIRQLVLEVHDLDGRVAALSKQLTDRGYAVQTEQDPMMKNTPIFSIYARRLSE
jgi:FkbM family methyltransferase